MTLVIFIPHRGRDESLTVVAGHARHLPADEDRDVSRQLVIGAMTRGLRTAGDLLDELEAASPERRRELLDEARAEAGLPSCAEVERRQRAVVTLNPGGSGFPSCAITGCHTVPMRLGTFFQPDVRRWHCPAHVHLAAPGDLEPHGSGIRLSPGGVPIPDDPAAEAAEREREAADRARREAQAEIRAVEGAAALVARHARDAAHARELPAHLRGAA